ncbi:protein EXORDIUM-like 2 [Fagus crenata]
MASIYHFTVLVSFLMLSTLPNPSIATSRMLALVKQPPVILKYHNGQLLKGNITVSLLWYGKFSPIQRSILIDFLLSLNKLETPLHPSVTSWWNTTGQYKGGGPSTLVLGNQILDEKYYLGKSLTNRQITHLALKAGHNKGNAISLVFTAADVSVAEFCMNECGTHGYARYKKVKYAYAWVGNPETQCPGQCAWPFHQPIYGPQTPPLVAPNRDVGVDGMVINLATVLAGAVTNPFDDGYYEGPEGGSLEAVSACTGIFGKGAYPGYPGEVLVDKPTGASYNAVGVNGRKYLLPAMWDPRTSVCKTFV